MTDPFCLWLSSIYGDDLHCMQQGQHISAVLWHAFSLNVFLLSASIYRLLLVPSLIGCRQEEKRDKYNAYNAK